MIGVLAAVAVTARPAGGLWQHSRGFARAAASGIALLALPFTGMRRGFEGAGEARGFEGAGGIADGAVAGATRRRRG